MKETSSSSSSPSPPSPDSAFTRQPKFKSHVGLKGTAIVCTFIFTSGFDIAVVSEMNCYVYRPSEGILPVKFDGNYFLTVTQFIAANIFGNNIELTQFMLFLYGVI